MKIKPPAPLLSMYEARTLAKKPVPDGEWPCIKCWGVGCPFCDQTGIVSRPVFCAWYRKHCDARRKALQAYQDELDNLSQNIVREDYYDLDRLRKVKRHPGP